MWHADPLLCNDCKLSNYTTALARQWLNSNHSKTHECNNSTATLDGCFLYGPCQDAISRTSIQTAQKCHYSKL
jgi:hypothetical protein